MGRNQREAHYKGKLSNEVSKLPKMFKYGLHGHLLGMQ